MPEQTWGVTHGFISPLVRIRTVGEKDLSACDPEGPQAQGGRGEASKSHRSSTFRMRTIQIATGGFLNGAGVPEGHVANPGKVFGQHIDQGKWKVLEPMEYSSTHEFCISHRGHCEGSVSAWPESKPSDSRKPGHT